MKFTKGNTTHKNMLYKGARKMKKNKILVLSLLACLIAIVSLGSLAWFNAEDDVTNEFRVANSEEDPDKIFSVDVWEDATEEDTAGEEKDQDGIVYDDILPGDKLFKEVHIENTGSYDQYIRATVTVTEASVWQDVFGMHLVPLSNFVDKVDYSAIFTEVSYYDAANDAFVYELYYKDPLAVGKELVVFDTVKISENLDRFQAAELAAGSFNINVMADAVQTENVGGNVYAAFNTVGLVKATPINNAADLEAALASEEEAYLIVDAAALAGNTLTIDSAVKNKTLDFNGADAAVEFIGAADVENVVISGIVDKDGKTPSVKTAADFTGEVTVNGCSFKDVAGSPFGAVVLAGGAVTVDNCEFVGSGKSYAIYSTSYNGELVIQNSTFTNLGSWAIQINGIVNGNLIVDNCVFETPDGVLKVLSGVDGDFTFTNNTMIGVKGHDSNPAKILVSGSGNGPVSATGKKTVTGNTLDGADWTL